MDSVPGVRKNLNGVHPRIPISYDLYKQLKTEASSEMQEGNVSCSKFIPLPSTVGKCRLAFMGRSSNPGASPDPNLMFVDVDPLLRNVDLSNWSDLIKPLRIDDRKKQRSVQHDLLLERKRQSPTKGVNDFSFTGNRLLMQGGKSSIFYADIGEIPKFVTHEVPALDNAAPRMDPKLCPGDVNYMAFYRNGNLWLQNIEKVGEIVQLTNAGQEDVDFKGVYAGWVNYLIQEEFDRYSGYYWQNTTSRTQRIVYEVSDESELETLTYVNHVAVAQQICTAGGASSGNARSAASSEAVFPSSGSKNPKTDIRFLTVNLPENETDKVTVRRFKLPIPLMEYLPWSETEQQGYVVRYGWIGDHGIWAHVLTRLQNKSAIIFIPINSFVDEESEVPDNFINQHPVFILHEWTSETWIKETDSIHFFDLKVAENGEEGKLDFIFHFENMSGFEHLFYLTALLNWNSERIPDLQFSSTIMCETMIRPITTGNWQVLNTGIDIDFANQLVYFQGMRDSPLETHLYRVNYQKGNAHDESCLRLTKSNFNHFDISVFIDENMFLVKSSNITTPTSIEAYRIPKPETAIFWTEEGVCPRPLAFLADDVTQAQQPKPEKLAKRESRGPEIFSFKNSSGDEIFGQIYKPENFDPKNKYPTIVYVYGGPRVQNIRNQFSASRSDRHRMYTKFGYVVLTFDNRGSDNRGLKFEGVIKDHMGYYEVQDQVEGIAYVSQNMGFIDVNRVAIEGWSYGGFMSLMAIAQYPDVFKIAISGAPVVDWRLYDSAYTERYLGLPQDNPKAYSDSSVVQQVPNLPDEPNRLLLFHGMIDENVITTNMMVLIEKLTRACKPYDLKLFVQERHSMRSSKTVEYYEMTVLTYLNQFL